jgi:hypothetical protein
MVSGQDLNPGPHKYKAGVLIAEPQHVVINKGGGKCICVCFTDK